MKETVKINLAQRLFDLDEDAYKKLKSYLDSLAQYFDKSSEESGEILFDIEQRIAEILEEKLRDKKQVVTLKDIDEVIGKMGTAEDFARESDFVEEETQTESEKDTSNGSSRKENRSLYRDTDSSIFGGVCSGLAAYFSIEPIWIRIVFIALFFVHLIGLFIYLILWIIVPPAKSRAQKLRMKGKPINIGNIEESVKNEFEKVKDNFSKISESEGYRRTRETAGHALSALGRIAIVLLKVLAVIIGISLAIAGLTLLISLIVSLTAGSYWFAWNFSDWSFPEQLLPLFRDITFFSLAIIAVIIIPVIAILAGIIHLIFNIRRGNSVLSAFAWTFWALALAFVIITLVAGKNELPLGYHSKDEIKMDISVNKTLYLRLDKEKPTHSRMEYYTVFGRELIRDKWNNSFLLEPEIEIIRSNDQLINVGLNFTSLLPWVNDDGRYPYKYRMKDSILVLDNYWTIDEDDLWRLPGLKVIVRLPESQTIHLDKDFRSVPTVCNEGEEWPDWYYGNFLMMGEEGLYSKEKQE